MYTRRFHHIIVTIGLGGTFLTDGEVAAQPRRSGPFGWEQQADRSVRDVMQTLRREERSGVARGRMQQRAEAHDVTLPARRPAYTLAPPEPPVRPAPGRPTFRG